MVIFIFASTWLNAQIYDYPDVNKKPGISIKNEISTGIEISFAISKFTLSDISIDGENMKHIEVPGSFLPNDEGAPDLPGFSSYIAIPEEASATIEIISYKTETIKNIDISPAPRIPLDTEDGPMEYRKNSKIYSTDSYFPAQAFQLSEITEIRGVDAVMLGITPFQYNPVTKELRVYYDVEIKITFVGGSGYFGDDRKRSPWWDQILSGELLNANSLHKIDYNQNRLAPSDSPDYDYIIITPDLPDFLSWADSIKAFRTLQGIKTGIVTTTEIGGNTVSAIESYVNNAYNTWAVAPSAVLLLGDYSTGAGGITSQMYTHPAGYPDFVSDNRFEDVTGNDLPDIVFARITANNADQLEVMITKFLDYERNPPTNPDFYNHPITALGWQTERWFQICSEVVGGYLKNEQGKNPVRINAVYVGDPTSDPWSTATNTSTVLNYFGPNGLDYIPATPAELGGFSGGTATHVVNAINAGSYLLQHRDHGYYLGWGEPAFNTSSINSLHNVNNELPFIFSINCQTGAFHRSTESFAEKFHRYTYNGQNSGALGVIAATEVSYSFVNDTYVWGVFDNLHPDFMPGNSAEFPVNFVMPAFGNAAGKHFLYQSSWPYNTTSKQITYRLFHHHGDAFMTLFTEVPQNLTVSHASVHPAASTEFSVMANAGSMIALTSEGEILATATGTGSPLNIIIPQQNPESIISVTVTKQNYYRHSTQVEVISTGLFAQFSADPTTLCPGGEAIFTDETYGNPISWDWSFPGGNPQSFNGQFPPAISYANPGSYDVILTVDDGASNDTQAKSGYITVNSLTADFTGSPTTLLTGSVVAFTDNTSCNPTSWTWSFPGGAPSSSTLQNPVITYNSPGDFNVTLMASNGSESDTEIKTGYISVSEVPLNYCSSQGSNASYEWISNVAFNDFSNTSGSAGYTDFTNLEIDLLAGEDVDVTLTPAFSGSTYVEFWRVWIDYNRDGDFEDSGEEVLAPASSNSQVNGSFTVSGEAIGKTRMRVSMKWNATPTFCETFGYGEVEDYTVNFISLLQPEADFEANTTSILEGQSVNFTDLSSNSPTSWLWEFSGGSPTSSTQQNPTVVYNNAGNFSVKLTAGNATGSDTETKINYITVGSLPECAGIIAPLNAATDVALTSNLQWSPADETTGYKIYFGTDNPPTNIENSTDLGNVLLYDPTILNYETMYFWKIIAYNQYGDATACSTWSFTTEDEPILAPPCVSFITPENEATEISISSLLEWNLINEADGYKIFFGSDNPPTNIENGTDLGNTEIYIPTAALSYSTTYFWQIIAYNLGGEATTCETWSFTTEDEPQPQTHFVPVWTSSFNPMSVFVVTATVENIDLLPGDEIGIFDIDPTSGNEICVGVGILSEILQGGDYLEIIASMDDASNPNQANGFTPGNEIIYKFYNNAQGEIGNISANYPFQGYDENYTSQGTAFVELSNTASISQTIALQSGWNMISFMAEPENMDMLIIVQPLIDQELFYKILDENGGSVFHLPFPPPNGQWSNTIGDMACTEGYYLKVFDNCELSTQGSPGIMPMEIALVEGWNMISYPCIEPTDAMNVLQALIDAEVLYKVVDENGGSIFHLPFPLPNGQWSNTIGNFESGEGYYIKVTDNIILTVDEPTKNSMFEGQLLKLPTKHFQPVYAYNPYMPMHIVVNTNGLLSEYDEIAVFDGDVCVGAEACTENTGDFIIITCAADDPETESIDGYQADNNINIIAWDNLNQVIFENASINYLSGDEQFNQLGTGIYNLNCLTTGLSNGNKGRMSLRIFPNPVKENATIAFDLIVGGKLNIEIYDIFGTQIKHVSESEYSTGNYRIDINTQELNSGYYLLKYSLDADNVSTINYQKFIIIK